MSFLKQTPADPRNPDRRGDDLDRLLRVFFRSEMPEPWPVLEPPAEQSFRSLPLAPRRRPLLRSRFALAASLLFLLFGALYLSGKFANFALVPTDVGPGNRIADKSRSHPGPKHNKTLKAPLRTPSRGAVHPPGL